MARDNPDQFGIRPNPSPNSLRYHQTAHSFELFGHSYRCHPLTPFEQINFSRKLAPIAIGALRADAGQEMILSRLTKLSNLLNKAQADAGADAKDKADGGLTDQQVTAESMELAEGVFGALAEIDEDKFNDILRRCMRKVFRVSEGGGVMVMWNDTHDMPTYNDVDGPKMLTLVGLYLFSEFRERIAEFVESMGQKPGPILAAMTGNQQRPPGAPGKI